jgi:hypothetical protein
MAFLKSLPLSKQPTCVLVAFYRHIAHPVDVNVHASPAVRRILTILHSRKYPLHTLL